MKKLLYILAFLTVSIAVNAQLDTVNIGTAPGSGDGDTVRVAFNILNLNDQYLKSLIDAGIDVDWDILGDTTNARIYQYFSDSGLVKLNCIDVNCDSAYLLFLVNGAWDSIKIGGAVSSGTTDLTSVDSIIFIRGGR